MLLTPSLTKTGARARSRAAFIREGAHFGGASRTTAFSRANAGTITHEPTTSSVTTAAV